MPKLKGIPRSDATKRPEKAIKNAADGLQYLNLTAWERSQGLLAPQMPWLQLGEDIAALGQRGNYPKSTARLHNWRARHPRISGRVV